MISGIGLHVSANSSDTDGRRPRRSTTGKPVQPDKFNDLALPMPRSRSTAHEFASHRGELAGIHAVGRERVIVKYLKT
jgi:hypothetical protein